MASMTERTSAADWIELMHQSQRFIRRRISADLLEQTRRDLIDRGVTNEEQLATLASPEFGKALEALFPGLLVDFLLEHPEVLRPNFSVANEQTNLGI
jgi:hypothetical protein